MDTPFYRDVRTHLKTIKKTSEYGQRDRLADVVNYRVA